MPRSRVLVVDDERLVASSLRRALAADHDVTVVSSARAAIRLVERGERYDVVLTDLVMPDVTGLELHRQLVALVPELDGRVLFMTAGAFTQEARLATEIAADACLEKPVRLDVLRAALARRAAVAAAETGLTAACREGPRREATGRDAVPPGGEPSRARRLTGPAESGAPAAPPLGGDAVPVRSTSSAPPAPRAARGAAPSSRGIGQGARRSGESRGTFSCSGFTYLPPLLTAKWRCGPVERPVEPT